MRTFAAILYLLTIGLIVLASYFVEYLGEDLYAEEISSDYIRYSSVITPLIEKDLLANPGQAESILKQWAASMDEDEGAITLIAHHKTSGSDSHSYLSNFSTTEQTDDIHIISPLTKPGFENQALFYRFASSYSDTYIAYYYSANAAVYLFMAIVISILSWLIFRYINRISKVTHSVAAGRFDLKMPSSRIPSLQQLASDINGMATSIEEKTAENLILTGAIHHELRIPITRIRLALDMAIHGNNDEITTELLTDMDTDLEELSSLMETLLTISRLRLKGVELEKEPVAIQALLIKIAADLKSPLINLAQNCDFTLSANYTLLERALYNIISNAVKYADKSVAITCKQQNEEFVLTVADDGPGIPEQERGLILKPFYRTDKSRTRNTGGFGLGLAIADMVIKDTQGTILIGDSEFGGAQISLVWSLVDK